jgi:hypothetical protein
MSSNGLRRAIPSSRKTQSNNRLHKSETYPHRQDSRLLKPFVRACALAGLWLNTIPASPAADLDLVQNTVFSNSVQVYFNGATATIDNGAGTGVTWGLTDSSVVVTSTVPGVQYVLTGAAASGYFKLQSTYAPKVTLSGVSLSCTNGPALSLISTNPSYLVLADKTTNTLSDSSTYTQSGEGVVYASGPLVFSGRGSAIVTGKKKHGIYSGSYLRMLGGDVAVAAAPKDAIHTIRYFKMDHGSLDLTATGDGIDGDTGYVELNGGSLKVRLASDDVKAVKCSGLMTVNGGALNFTISGAQSKGLSCSSNIVINGGTMLMNLSGSVYLQSVTNVSGTTTNRYVDPSYCCGIKCDTNVTINAGTIVMTHSGLAGKGISVDGSLSILGGNLDITTTGGNTSSYTNDQMVLDLASADCIKADGNLQILGGTITALSTGNAGDAISTDGTAVIGVSGVSNTPVITAMTRGQKVLLSGSGNSADYANPKAFKAEGNLTVNGGIFRASTKNDGGEGMESKGNLTINSGNLEINAYDDCINATSNITVNGGQIYCYASGNDGIDSNGTFKYTGGLIITSGTTAPEEGFDCDQNNFAISGGTMVGTGGGTSTPTSASCTQRTILYTGPGIANSCLQIKSSTTNLLVYKIPRSYSGSSGMILFFSSPSIASGASCTIVTNVTVSGGTEFHGYYTGATVSGGATAKTFTVSTTSMVTSVK